MADARAGIAGGADVILIPEIPTTLGRLLKRFGAGSQAGTNFSIVAVAEGAMRAGRTRRLFERRAKGHQGAEQGGQDRLQSWHWQRSKAKHSGNTLVWRGSSSN